jgi:hypothetical protein
VASQSTTTSVSAAPGVFPASRVWERAQRLGHGELDEPPSVPSGRLVLLTGQLRLAVAACLARFKGCSCEHTESDLRCYLAWCVKRGPESPARLAAVGTAVRGAPVMGLQGKQADDGRCVSSQPAGEGLQRAD